MSGKNCQKFKNDTCRNADEKCYLTCPLKHDSRSVPLGMREGDYDLGDFDES